VERHGTLARDAAMLGARHDFLADIAALVEIDAAELIHVSFMGKGVAINEINPAARYAERDAVRFIVLRARQRGAKLARCLRRAMRRDHHPKPERRQARIGIA
jgi:hypothetical protein